MLGPHRATAFAPITSMSVGPRRTPALDDVRARRLIFRYETLWRLRGWRPVAHMHGIRTVGPVCVLGRQRRRGHRPEGLLAWVLGEPSVWGTHRNTTGSRGSGGLEHVRLSFVFGDANKRAGEGRAKAAGPGC